MSPPAEPAEDHAPPLAGPDTGRLFAAAPFGVVLVDRRGCCAMVDGAVGALLGVQVGDRFVDGVPGCDELTRTVKAAFGTGAAPPELEVVVRRDGAPQWLAFECFPVPLPDLVGVLVRDVTDRRAREDRLLDRAGLATAAQEAAEVEARREQVLQELTAAFAAAVTPEAVADIVIRAVLECVDADGGALYLLDDVGERLRTIGVDYPFPWGAPQLDVALDAGYPVCAAVRDNAPQFIADADELHRRFPDVARFSSGGDEWGRHAALPLGLTGSIGAVAFSWTRSGPFVDRDREFLSMIAAQCGLALKRSQLFLLERQAREHTERAAENVLRLERITGALASAVEPTAVLERFLGEALPALDATHGAVFELDAADGSLTSMALLDAAESARFASAVADDGPARDALASRLPVLRDDWIAIPMLAYGESLGVVVLGAAGPWRADADDRAFLAKVGERLAEAFERGRLFARQRDAREQAEAAARWLRSVQSMAAALARSATRREVARALREHLQPATRADMSIVAAAGPRGGNLEVLTGTSVFAMALDHLSERATRSMRESILRGRSLELANRDEIARAFPSLLDEGVESFTLVPVRVGRSVVAAIGLGWRRPDALTEEGRRLLAIAVSLGGAALERAAAHDLDHHIAETLQRHLLTEPTTVVPGVPWAARYAPGREELTAGGDWYDVIALPDGRVAAVVGDIVGHGVVAAAAMGQLRSATRALALRADPVGVLESLDVYAATTGQGNLSSLAYAVFDPATGELEFAVAGHPPPLLLLPGGRTEFYELARGPLIGLAEPQTRTSVRRVVEPGTSVVLYTDGIVERRGASIDDGMARMADLVEQAPRDLHPEGICDVLLRRLGTEERAPDDITLLVFEHLPLRGPFNRRYPARLEMLRVLRTDVRAWLGAHDVGGDAAIDLLLMCGEAAANAISHGTTLGSHDTIGVSLEHLGDAVVIVVADNGTWPEHQREPEPGHGLDIMTKAADEFSIQSNSFGTTVRMLVRLSADRGTPPGR